MSCFPSYRDREPLIAPAVALLNSHMADFDTAEVLLLRSLSDFFLFAFLTKLTSILYKLKLCVFSYYV